jgi:hypothetical protein
MIRTSSDQSRGKQSGEELVSCSSIVYIFGKQSGEEWGFSCID